MTPADFDRLAVVVPPDHEPVCICGHPVKSHKAKLFETTCGGKLPVDDKTPVWVAARPCPCRECVEVRG